MAVRVSQVVLQVLRVPPKAQTLTFHATYDHDYEAYDGSHNATYAVEIGYAQEGIVGNGNYVLAGFEGHDGLASGTYDLDAYLAQNAIGQGVYTLNVYSVEDKHHIAQYQLQAFVELDGKVDSEYALNIYEPQTQVFHSEYELQVYLLKQGYVDGLYSVGVFTDAIMHMVSQYALEVYEQQDVPIATGTYDLNAWEAREQIAVAQYAIEILSALNFSHDSQYAIEVLTAFTEKFGVHYDLNALEALNGIAQGNAQILTYRQFTEQFTATYDISVLEVFNGLFQGTNAINAFAAEQLAFVAQWGIEAYVSQDGFAQAEYDILARLSQTGFAQGSYLLDVTEALQTWVINHDTQAPSRYEGFGFNAFAQLGEQYLAADGNGIFLLEGDDDAGTDIDALATIGLTDMEESRLKRVTGAYLGMSSTGQVHLTLTTDKGVTSGPYQLREAQDGDHTERSKFARGIKSRYWQIDLENVLGSDVRIDGLELETQVIKHRLKK